jgi:hypothetical protein
VGGEKTKHEDREGHEILSAIGIRVLRERRDTNAPEFVFLHNFQAR